MHPDWYLHVPGRPRQIGRNQYVLDLSRKAVRDYLYDILSAVLSSANIEYIKWDCNRPLTEVYSQRANDYTNVSTSTVNNSTLIQGQLSGQNQVEPTIWQSETSHRYVLGLYELQDRITQAFPHILLENCSSGGKCVGITGFRISYINTSMLLYNNDNIINIVLLSVIIYVLFYSIISSVYYNC